MLAPQIPVMTHVHELEFAFHAKASPALSRLLAKTHRFIACSNAVKENLLGIYEVPAARVETIYESIPVDQVRAERTREQVLRELHIPDNALLVAGSGTAGWRKGTDLFVQLAQAVCRQHPRVYFTWIGGWEPELAQLEHDIRLAGLSDKIRVTGLVSKPADYLSAADVFVLTSREDPYPLVCLEAAALQRPIVCLAGAGWMPEFVEGDCGFVVPYLDIMAMAGRVIALLDSPECRFTMGAAARRKVVQRHDIGEAAPRIMEIIDRTVAGAWAPSERKSTRVTSCRDEAMLTVSVIVPNYNHARFVAKRIESILRQTFQDFELILLDDRSTDESRSILREYASDPRVRLEFSEVNSGSTYKQWNKGVRLARRKYVWIAESHDYADVRLLERLVPVLETEPLVIFVYCRTWRVTEEDRREGFGDSYLVDLGLERWGADYLADGHEECRNYFVHRNIVGNATAVLFRKELYERVGGADDGLRMCGDWKVRASMALLGQVAYISEPLSFFRAHSDSIWGKGRKQGLAAEETLRVVRWMAGQVTPSDFASGIMFDTLARAVWIPAVISRQVPLRQKWMIVRDATAIDKRAIRRLAGALAVGLRLKFLSAARRLGQGYAR